MRGKQSLLLVGVVFSLVAIMQTAVMSEEWKTSWAASVQGPYPVGNPTAQPELKFAFPVPEQGAVDQTFRLLVRPTIWGGEARLRFSNAFGTKPLTIDGVFAGLHMASAAVVEGTNQPVTFNGNFSVTIPPGEIAWSDGVMLPFVFDMAPKYLFGRKLAVSFHIKGESGPMTWHAKALNTSYVSKPKAGAVGAVESETHFPYSTTSWYFLDAVDMMAPAGTMVIAAFGDSITDGTASTLNGEDRWPDAFSRILHATYGNRIAVVNAGIGGNEVSGPPEYSAGNPYRGGPAALARIDRDVLSLSGVNAVIWLEGINDFSKAERSFETVRDGMREVVQHIRKTSPRILVIGATLPTAFGSDIGTHGTPEQDAKRKALNDFIRNSGVFDGFVDFDAVTVDPATGQMRAEFVPGSTTGGDGDKLHPNRAGYLRMAESVDVQSILR